MRSQGYGRSMTEAACSLIDAAGCKTQALDCVASTAKPLYDSMGFRVDALYQIPRRNRWRRRRAPPLGRTLRRGCGPTTSIEFANSTSGRPARIDAGCLAPDAFDGRAWVLEAGDELLGFLASLLPGCGALVASRPEDAACLLDQLRYLDNGADGASGRAPPAQAQIGRCGRARTAGLEPNLPGA